MANTQIITTTISAIATVAAALGSVWLKGLIDRRHQNQGVPPPVARKGSPATEARETLMPPEARDTALQSDRSGRSWIRPVVILVSGFLTGIVTALGNVLPDYVPLTAAIGIGSMLVVPVALVVRHARHGSFGVYQLELLTFFAASALGASLLYGDKIEIFRFVGFWWFGWAVVGGVAVFLSGKSRRIVAR